MWNAPQWRPEATDSLIEIVDLAYAAAAEPDGWPAFLEAAAGLFRASGIALVHHDLVGTGHVSRTARIDPETTRLYEAHYHRLDPWIFSPRARELMVPHRVVTDDALLPRDELRKTAYFNELALPYGITRMMSSIVERSDEATCGLSVLRAEGQPPFTPSEERLLAHLGPHVQRALGLHRRLTEVRARSLALSATLERSAQAIVILDASGHVCFANPAALALTALGDGVSLGARRLSAAHAGDASALAQAIAAAYRHPHPAVTNVTLRKPSGGRPMQVLVAPVRDGNPLEAIGGAVAVFITDPDAYRCRTTCGCSAGTG